MKEGIMRLDSWSEYLEPICLLFSCVVAVLFFCGFILENAALVTMLFSLCLCLFSLSLVGLAICFWRNRGAAAELRDLVTAIQNNNVPDGEVVSSFTIQRAS